MKIIKQILAIFKRNKPKYKPKYNHEKCIMCHGRITDKEFQSAFTDWPCHEWCEGYY